MNFIFPQYDLTIAQDFWRGKLNQSIVLFGAGAIGRLVYDFLGQKGLEINCFCDNNPHLQGSYYEQCPIISPEEVDMESSMVIICSKYEGDMTKQLQQIGAKTYLPAYSLFSQQEVSDQLCQKHLHALCALKSEMDKAIIRRKTPDSLIIDNVDIIITEKCSLRCRDCSNLMQYYQQPEHENEETLFAALDKLMQAVDWICELRVLGGEPFMNKKIAEYLAKICAYPKSSYVMVYSNATIMPDDNMWKSLRHEKIIMLLSDYRALSRNLERITEKAKVENIKYQITAMEEWQDCASIAYHARNEQELKMLYKQCCVRDALTLKSGRLYGCPFSANATKLGAIPDFAEDYIDFLALDETIDEQREKLKTFLKRECYQACQYCEGRPIVGGKTVPPAIQAEKPLAYHKYEC